MKSFREILEADKKLLRVVNDWLKLSPDYVIFNGKIITSKLNAEALILLVKSDQDTVTISKDTLEGNIGIQIFRQGKKVQYENL